MYKADISVTVFKYVGIWPTTSLYGFLTIYNTYSIFMIFSVFVFTTANVLYLFQNLDIEEFTECLFSVLAIIVICVKMAVILTKHSKILEITDTLHSKAYEPQDCEEHHIQEIYDKIGRFGTITFIAAVTITVLIRATGPLSKNDSIRSFKMWVPYSLENSTSYWLTYLFYLVAYMTVAQTSVAGDTFAIVMMLQLCAQLEILEHRIQKYPRLCMDEVSDNPRKGQRTLGKWIQHHNSLFIFAKKLNDVYNEIFCILFLSTTADICTSTYVLATLSITSIKFWSMTVSLTCIIFELYLFCFQGSFLAEKSMGFGYAAYSINWVSLSKSSRRDIIHIIRRSSKPITFTAGSIVPLSIDTLTSILRMSYSLYTCLTQSYS